MGTHFLNLSNGLACAQHIDGPPHYTRIQSTLCEAKRWDLVLAQAGDDLLYHLATGADVTVHDESERDRQTRAMWQGLEFIRYSAERAWGLEPRKVWSRNGMNVTAYAAQSYDGVPDRIKDMVRYHRKYVTVEQVTYSVCDGKWRA